MEVQHCIDRIPFCGYQLNNPVRVMDLEVLDAHEFTWVTAVHCLLIRLFM